MNEDARDNFEEDDFQEAVARFKKMVKSNTSKYFDVFEVEGIIDHFLVYNYINRTLNTIFIQKVWS